MSHIRNLSLCCLVAFASASSAKAQSLTGNVGSANIGAGDRAAEARLGVDDAGSAASRFHYEYAFSDWYQLRTIASFRRPEDGEWAYSGLTLENWFQWAEEGGNNEGFNGGVRLAYTFASDDRHDTVALRVTTTDRFAGAWEWRANLIAGSPLNDPGSDGAELESRLQISRALPGTPGGATKWRAGAELFSEFRNAKNLPNLDEQAHQIGPVVKADLPNGVFLQAALRAGLTPDSDDVMAKVFIGREF